MHNLRRNGALAAVAALGCLACGDANGGTHGPSTAGRPPDLSPLPAAGMWTSMSAARADLAAMMMPTGVAGSSAAAPNVPIKPMPSMAGAIAPTPSPTTTAPTATMTPAPTNDGKCCADCICRNEHEPTVDELDKNGPYQSKTFTLPAGANHGGATVYYPTDAKPPLAFATFCPPYTATQVAFAAWGPFFASHGIVLATMDSRTTGDYPPQRALGLQELMEALAAESGKADGPLAGKLHPQRMGVLGWSMGGGGVWLASGKHPEWKSAITLAGHNITATGWEEAAKLSMIPTMMLNGATDTSILGGMNQTQNAYKTIPDSTNKLMYIMSDLGHFDWGSPTTEANAAGRYVMAWEKTFLEGDTRYRKFILVKGPNAATWETNLQ